MEREFKISYYKKELEVDLQPFSEADHLDIDVLIDFLQEAKENCNKVKFRTYNDFEGGCSDIDIVPAFVRLETDEEIKARELKYLAEDMRKINEERELYEKLKRKYG
jgi:hypothetical protein